MAEQKASVSKVGDSAATPVVDASARSESPAPTGGDTPVREAILTGNEADAQSVSADDSKKDELQQEARDRGLDDSGTKQELADRINEHDEQGVHKPEVLYPHEEE